MYIRTLEIHKIIDQCSYLLMTLEGKILRGLLEYERLRTATIRSSQGNVFNLPQHKQLSNIGIRVDT